jgi:hypothetical protein
VEGTPKSAPRRSLLPLLPPFLPPSSSLSLLALAPSGPLGVEGTPKSAPRRSLLPLLPPPFFLPPSSFLSLPSRPALLRRWAWRVPRNPHLGEACCLFSPPSFLLLPSSSPSSCPHCARPLGSLGVEGTPKSAPRRSLLPASSSPPPHSPSSLFLSFSAPPRPLRSLAPLGPLGVEGTPKSAPRRSLLPLLPPPSSSFLLSSFLFAPCLCARCGLLGRGGVPRNPHLGEACCLFFPPPPSFLLLSSSFAPPLAPALARAPWAWRATPKSRT